MTTTTRSTATTASDSAPRAALRAPALVPPRGRRRPGLITAGVALTMLGALTAVWLVTSAGDRTGVVVVARDVPYGTAITADDLTVAQVSVDPVVRTVPADDGPGAAPLPVPSVPGARRRRRRRLLCCGLLSLIHI